VQRVGDEAVRLPMDAVRGLAIGRLHVGRKPSDDVASTVRPRCLVSRES
jgi:hypothetical protein